MFDVLKNILGKKEPATFDLEFDGIPAWVASHEAAAKETLVSSTAEQVRNIRNTAAQLQIVVNNIAGAEHDPVLHPKLKSIAKNSLPLFVRAMNSALEKELPDDREEFYVAAVECVRNCLNSSRGQGRYLQVVFPEEMKTVKGGIDTMGREINLLTKALSAYRSRVSLAGEVRTLHEEVFGMKEDLIRSVEKDERSKTRIDEIRSRITAIGTELAGLRTDANIREIDGLREEVSRLGKARDDAIRRYAALSMTASHVFRKAEKISVRQHRQPETGALRHVMEILSGHAVPGREELAAALGKACPVAGQMIDAGEIALKNKEERGVFADTARFCTEICTAAADVREHEGACAAAEQKVATHPLLARIQSLEREAEQQKAMLAKEEQLVLEREEWRKKTEGEIPARARDLGEKAGILAGSGVRVRLSGA
jgi:hypothetical protein